MRILAVRNRNLSLWQSAVSEVAAKFAHSDPKLMSAMELAACMHAAAAANGVDIQPPAPDATITNDSSPSNLRALAYVSKMVFDLRAPIRAAMSPPKRRACSSSGISRDSTRRSTCSAGCNAFGVISNIT